MSRRLLLAGGGSGAVVVPEDPDDPDIPDGDGFPATSDPILASLRPTGVRVIATATATPGDDVGVVEAEMYADMDPFVETEYSGQTMDHSCILYLPPGEYRGGFGTSRWQSIVGLGDSPEDVIIISDTIASDGVVHPYGPLYVENLTLKAEHGPLDQSPKYCAHISGNGRVTFANVIFDSTEAGQSATDSTWSGGATVGMDGSPGTVLIFYKCDFRNPGTGSGMNLHGGPIGTVPSRISFIDCIAPRGIQYSYGAGDGDPANVNDEVYVIGGTIGGSITVSPNVDVYTDLDNAVNNFPASVTRDHTNWPQPVDKGLTQFWLDYLLPSGLLVPGTTDVKPVVTDAAPMTPVAGRTYYCPIPVTQTLWFNRWGLQVHSGGGTEFVFKASPDKQIYYGSMVNANEPHPDIRVLTTNNSVLANGKYLSGYHFSYIGTPATPVGGNRMWFAFKIPDTTGVSIDGSAMLPGLHDCYYSDDNGTTLVKATAGTPFPLAHAAQFR